MLVGALLIHVSGGRIETHFHIFGSLAFLALYRDWRVLIAASAIVAMDHFVRGISWPRSVYGIATVSPWRWMEHAAWVVFEDIVLIRGVRQSLAELRDLAARQAEAETARASVDRLVEERTAQLERANAALVAEVAERQPGRAGRPREPGPDSAILETAPDAILAIDRRAGSSNSTPAAEGIFGFHKADVLGRDDGRPASSRPPCATPTSGASPGISTPARGRSWGVASRSRPCAPMAASSPSS